MNSKNIKYLIAFHKKIQNYKLKKMNAYVKNISI